MGKGAGFSMFGGGMVNGRGIFLKIFLIILNNYPGLLVRTPPPGSD